MDLSQPIERDPDFVVRSVGPKHVLVPIKRPIPHDVLMFLLDGPVAIRLWELLERPHTRAELVETVLAEFEAERAVVEEELSTYLEQLQQLGAIRPASA